MTPSKQPYIIEFKDINGIDHKRGLAAESTFHAKALALGIWSNIQPDREEYKVKRLRYKKIT